MTSGAGAYRCAARQSRKTNVAARVAPPQFVSRSGVVRDAIPKFFRADDQRMSTARTCIGGLADCSGGVPAAGRTGRIHGEGSADASSRLRGPIARRKCAARKGEWLRGGSICVSLAIASKTGIPRPANCIGTHRAIDIAQRPGRESRVASAGGANSVGN